ncbi:hypothetical protein L486_05451 [Kwoniella mangroviensis CBS 10435]|uniref:Uncharacterized protein n=1 Tax=Kwoniella mangroviensis CBS 10435 TaxID=1331196 RepID=A0A1B9ILW2_9TREE|nr:hypothetical protein L486_05451 [Kwoniella mangroviensis CBS 10435]
MKTSTSFAILALLASAGTTFAAPLPHHSNHKGSDVESGHRGGHHHSRAEHPSNHHILDATVNVDMDTQRGTYTNGKHHHARADPLSVTKPLSGTLGLPTNGHKMGKTKGNNANQPLTKTLSPTSDSIHGSLKPLNSDTTKAGQQLNHPNSGDIGHLGKTADDALEPQETQISKNVLPRDVVPSAIGGNSVTKPVQTAATGLGNNVASVNNNGKNDIPVAGSVIKPITSGSQVVPGVTGGDKIAPPTLTSTLLNSKGGVLDLNAGPLVTNGGVVGTAGKAVTGLTGTLTNGQGALVNSQTATGTVGKVPGTVGGVIDSANVDPVSNQAYQLNTDDTESDVKAVTGNGMTQANDHGPKQTNKKVNSSAFKGDGLDHRLNGHGSDGTKDRTTELISDNTSNVKQTSQDTTGIDSNNTSNNVNHVNSTFNTVTTPNGSSSTSGLKKTSDGTMSAVDQSTDQAIPSSSQKNKGTLVTANNDNANAKIVQTPGKSDKVAETNTNDVTGSKSSGDNVNIKVAVPQHQATQNQGTTSGGLVNNGNKIGPNDQRGNVVQEVGDGKILKQNIVNPSSPPSSAKHTSSATKPHPTSASVHSSSAVASHSASASKGSDHPTSMRPQVFVEYTSFASSPSSTIASQSASVPSTTPLAQAQVHSGTIQVNKNQQSATNVKLPLTSSLHLPLPSTTSKTLKTATTKPRQAQVTYGQKGEHVVACDGQKHQPNDMIDECIKADLLDFKPNQTEACPTDMQHDIQYGLSTDMLKNDQQANKEIQKYVRLCLKASAL